MFIEFNKRFIQQIIVNCFRFIVVKIDNAKRQIKNIFLSLYSVEWLLNRAIFRQMILQFDKNIIAFRNTFSNFKFRFFNFNNSFSFFESLVSRNHRFCFFSSATFVFYFIFSIESTKQSKNRQFSFFDFFVFRANLMSIINIKVFDNFEQFINSNQSIIRQSINFTNSTFTTITNIIIIEN